MQVFGIYLDCCFFAFAGVCCTSTMTDHDTNTLTLTTYLQRPVTFIPLKQPLKRSNDPEPIVPSKT